VAYGGGSTAPDGRLPWGWTHSYSSRVILNGSGKPTALFRPNGSYVTVFESSTNVFLATDASGIQARGAGSNDITVYLPDGSKEIYGYHSDTGCSGGLHRLDTVVDPGGRETTVGYDNECSADPTQIEGPFGHTLNINYGQIDIGTGYVDRIVEIVGSGGESIHFDYVGTGNGAATGQLQYVTYQDTTRVEYHYDDPIQPGYLAGITDEPGVRYATFAYNNQRRAIRTEHIGGYDGWDFIYGVDGTATATDANGRATTYSFQTAAPKRRIIGSITLDGSTRTMTNETSGQMRLLTTTDENGVTTTNAYSTYHLTSKTDATNQTQQRVTQYGYLDDVSARLTSVTTPSVYSAHSRVVSTSYNANGLPETVQISGYTPSGTAVSRSIGLSYDSHGQVTDVDGPRTGVNDVTTLTYYECTTGGDCGQLASVTNALGQETTYDTYDDNGRLTQMTDSNGVVTTYAYDLRGRVLTVTATPPSGPARVATYTYDDAGQLATVEAANGTVLTYDYDDAHNLQFVTDNDGNKIAYGYDLNGNRTSEDVKDVSDNLKKTIAYTYDARNRIDTINSAGSITAMVVDAVGNLTDETDPNSNDTTHQYDPLNRLVHTIDALTQPTDYGYDVNDALTSVTAPNGASTSYVYDDLGDLLSVSSPDTGTTSYTYDAAGNRLTQTDANGVTTTFTYDALNRLAAIEYPTSTLNVSLTYDEGTNQKGRLTTMVDGNGTATFGYDVYGNVTQESKTIDGHAYVTGYSYDAADLLVSITYPSGRTVDYTRNVLGQVTTLESTYDSTTTTVADDIEYEPFGPLSALTFGNGLALARTFDQQYRLTAQTTGAIQDLGFTYDDASNVDAVMNGVNGALSQGFSQDALNRVDSEAGVYGTKTYTYDSVGNRLTRVHDNGTVTTQTLTYLSNSNRLATDDGNTVTLDSAGNTMTDLTPGLSFTYGDNNRMLEAYVGGVLQASYVYNAQGQRMKKVEATGARHTTIFHYGLNGEIIGETVYDNAGAKVGERDYVWLDTLPMAQSERVFSSGVVTSSQFEYLHADQLNTPRLATDGSGTVVWRWDSDAFGAGTPDTDPDGDMNLVDVRLRFPGQYFDEETGLHYNYFRDYDPAIGRYIESDPIGLGGGINTYAYGGANPISNSDRLGLYCSSAGGWTTCHYPGGPSFRLPTPVGFPASLNSSYRQLYHRYDVQRDIGCANPEDIMQALINHPTPGTPSAATPGGTRNNAPALIFRDNTVTSYLTKDLNTGAPLVVNMTDPGSAFHPGYVARTVTNGVAHSYGEGLNGWQSPAATAQWFQNLGNEVVWGGQMVDLVRAAKGNCACQ
jgi:RHS repeat-associated protein